MRQRFSIALLSALVFSFLPNAASNAEEAQCQTFGVLFFGTPYEQDFGTACGADQINATQIAYNQYSQDNFANAINWVNQQVQQQSQTSQEEIDAATKAAQEAEEAARAAAAAAEAAALAAKLAAEEAERLAAEEAARLAAEEAERAAQQNNNPAPLPLDCTKPENVGIPLCQPALQAITNPDGSLNCANPINTTTTVCMEVFKNNQSGELNCALPELQNLPACYGKVPAPVQVEPAPVVETQPAITPEAPSPVLINTNPIVETQPAGATGMVSPKNNEIKPAETPKVELPITPVIQTPILTQLPTVSTPVPVQTKDPVKKEENFEDSDGEEEPISAALQVNFNANLNRFIIRIDSNLVGEVLTVRATKKGSKPIRFTIQTDEDGIGGIRTRTKLNGFTLTVIYNGEVLSKVRV